MDFNFQRILSTKNVRLSVLAVLGIFSISVVHYIGFTFDFPNEWPLRLAFELAPILASELSLALVISAGITKLAYETIRHITPALVSPLLLLKRVKRWAAAINSESRMMQGLFPGLYVGVFWASFAEIYLDRVRVYDVLFFLVFILLPLITFPYIFTLKIDIIKNRIKREMERLKEGRLSGHLLPTVVFATLFFAFVVGSERFSVVASQPMVEIEFEDDTVNGFIIAQINGGIIFGTTNRQDRNGLPEIKIIKGNYTISSADVQ